MLSLVYRHAALADLDAIYAYIEPDNPRRASFRTFGIDAVRFALIRSLAVFATISVLGFAFSRCSDGSSSPTVSRLPLSWSRGFFPAARITK